jgi:hypothetical protein
MVAVDLMAKTGISHAIVANVAHEHYEKAKREARRFV